MDWAKAKAVLIVAFLITDLFLGYSLYSCREKETSSIYNQEEYKQSFHKLLDEKNIKLQCVIPRETPKLGTLIVKYENPKDANINRYINNNSGVNISNGNTVQYKSKYMLSEFSKEEAIDASNQFINKYGLQENAMLKDVVSNENEIEVTYTSKYNEYFLEESYMKCSYNKNGDFYFERMWLTPIKENKQKREITNSVEAIISVYNQLKENSTIQEIKLGYYLDMMNSDKIENVKSATAFPTWRIKIDNKYYYVQAFDF